MISELHFASHLGLYLGTVRILPLHLSVHVLLELLHVKQLESSVQLEESVRQLEDLVAHRRLLEDVLDVDVALAHPLHQDVPVIPHLQFAAGPNLGFELLDLVISQRIVKAIHSDLEAIKAVFGAIDRKDGRPCVGFGHPSVPLENDHLCPDLVLDVVPLLKHLGNVVLQSEQSCRLMEGSDR